MPRVSPGEWRAGVERCRKNLQGHAGAVSAIFVVLGAGLGVSALFAEDWQRDWFLGAAVASGLMAVVMYKVVKGVGSEQLVRRFERLRWDDAVSFNSPSHGLAYIRGDAVASESGLFRRPPRFLGVAYAPATHALVLSERDNEGDVAEISITLPASLSAAQANATVLSLLKVNGAGRSN
ncbi:MAG: hypothetical protein FJ086_16805 [Deltaproteobacteria bacterium]|nr:hypothetical protein [Deltaproteobacteria bacterium]